MPSSMFEKIQWWYCCKKTGYNYDKSELVDIEHVRYFNVYEIPNDLILKLEENHNLFRFYIGTHTDYDSQGRRDRGSSNEHGLGGLMPYDMHDKFYKGDHSEVKVDTSKYPVIGRFKI